jgi:hypothetical protein
MTKSEMHLNQNYHVYFEDGSRVYKIDLCEKTYNMDSYTPSTFIIDGKPINEGTWTRLLERLSNYLINKYSLSEDAMLNYEVEWSKAPIFLKEGSLSAHIKLNNELYVNCNRTSTHLCWSVQEILKMFKVACHECELYVNIPQAFENPNVTNFVYDENRRKLSEFMDTRLNYSVNRIKAILAAIEKMDVLLQRTSSSYLSFLMLDTNNDLTRIKSRFKEKTYPTITDRENIKTIEAILKILTNYFKYKDETRTQNELLDSIAINHIKNE